MRVQIALQYQHRCYLIDYLLALIASHIRVNQHTPRARGGEPFVLKCMVAIPFGKHRVCKCARDIRLHAVASVHIARHSEKELDRLITVRQLDQMIHVLIQIIGTMIGFNPLRGKAQWIADGNANSLFANVKRKNSKHVLFPFHVCAYKLF